MNIKPLRDKVVIDPIRIEEERKTKSGIIIPETVGKDEPGQGKIVAVGPGRLDKNKNRIPMEIRKGDIVLFTKYGPSEIKVAGKKYLVTKEKDILAIIK